MYYETYQLYSSIYFSWHNRQYIFSLHLYQFLILEKNVLIYLCSLSPSTGLGALCPLCPFCPGRTLVIIACLRLFILSNTVSVVPSLPALSDPGSGSSSAGLRTLWPWSPWSPGRTRTSITWLSLSTSSGTRKIWRSRLIVGHSEVCSITSSLPGPLPLATGGAALRPRCPFAPEGALPVVTTLPLLSLPLTQTTGFTPSLPVRSRALPQPLTYPSPTRGATRAPSGPLAPGAQPLGLRTHALLLVTVHTGAVTRGLGNGVDGVTPDVGRWTIVTHQEVLKVTLNSKIMRWFY